MKSVKDFFYFLSALTLVLAFFEIYLKASKLWQHKHENDAAESISISGEFLSLGPMIIWAINYYFIDYWVGLVDESLLIILGSLRILVGAKTWVKVNQENLPESDENCPIYEPSHKQSCLASLEEKNTSPIFYYVIVVPQSKEQQKIASNLELIFYRKLIAKTDVYHSQPFESEEKAKEISTHYRKLNLYSIVSLYL